MALGGTRPLRVAVVGSGYVGLSTGIVLAYLCHDVVCLDVDTVKVAALGRGEIPFHEPGLTELLGAVGRRLAFTSSTSQALTGAEVVLTCVGTPASGGGSPDLTQLEAAVRSIGRHADQCRVLAVKSTVPPGTAGLVKGWLKSSSESAAGAGSPAIAVLSNPEFLREGNALHDAFYPDRIVIGGNNDQGVQVLTELYQPLTDQTFAPPPGLPRPLGRDAVPLVLTTSESAELIKYAANAFLAAKISFINEMAALAERVGADITDVSRGIGLDARIGPLFLRAGLGWGGSCLGKDITGLLHAAERHGVELPVTAGALRVNELQRDKVVRELLERLGGLRGRTITLLGLAFKPHTDDIRDAPALAIAARLAAHGAAVRAHDPLALPRARAELPVEDVSLHEDVIEAARGADALVLVTDWPEYRDLPWAEIRQVVKTPLVLDGRNHLDPVTLAAAGLEYQGIGRPLKSRSFRQRGEGQPLTPRR